MDDITGLADRFGMPAAAVDVFAGRREQSFCLGVTSVENPLPVTSVTLFLLGSVTKTFTETALLRMVGEWSLPAGTGPPEPEPARRSRERLAARSVRPVPPDPSIAEGVGEYVSVSDRHRSRWRPNPGVRSPAWDRLAVLMRD
jgi:beta-lactamase family protein